MAKKEGTSKKAIIRETRGVIYDKLNSVLAEYEQKLGKKKYDNQLKKFSKLLASEIRSSKSEVKKKVEKIKTPKKKKAEQPAKN